MPWLAINFPQLQLDSLCFLDREEALPACVIVDGKQRVLQGNAVALSAGITTQMSLGTASALVEPLRFYDLDPAFQLSRLNELAQCCYQQSADIVVREKNSCLLLEVGSMLSLHGSLDGYLSALFSVLQTQDVSYTVALADTPLAAELLACYQPAPCGQSGSLYQPGSLHQSVSQRSCLDAYLSACLSSETTMEMILGLPLQCLDIPNIVVERLLRLGLHTVSDLQTLPKKELAMKLGPDLLLYLDQVLGRVATPVSFFKPLEHFKRSFVFEQEVSHASALLFPLKYALEGFELFLRERSLVAQTLCVDLLDRQQKSQRILLSSAESEASAQVWVSLLRLKLETIELKQPVLAVVLECTRLLILEVEHWDLFTGARSSQSANFLLSRIQARLGERSVSRIELRDDHRPEYSFSVKEVAGSVSSRELKKQGELASRVAEKPNHYAAERVSSSKGPIARDMPHITKSDIQNGAKNEIKNEIKSDKAGIAGEGASFLALRPSLLFDVPHVLSESVRIIHGPERIQSAWWSDHEVCRDYFVAISMSKQRLWVFRDHDQQWFVHGLFA